MIHSDIQAIHALSMKFNFSKKEIIPGIVDFHRSETGNMQKRFRIKVLGGGCSGFQYNFSIDNTLEENDIVFKSDATEVEIVTDEHSIVLIDGCTISYNSSLGGEYFYMKNPNAKSNCSCGSSFSV